MDEHDWDDAEPFDSDLGRLVAEFRAGSPMHLQQIGAALLVAGLFAAATGVALDAGAVGRVARSGVAGLLAVLAPGAVLTGVPMAVAADRVRRLWWRVLVFEHGVAAVRSAGTQSVLWGEVETLVEDPAAGSGAVVHLRTRAGRTLDLDGTFRDSPALAAAVRAGVTAAQLPAAVAELAAGREVRFGGRVAVSPAGVRDAGRSLAWADVAAAAGPTDGPHLALWRAGHDAAWLARPAGTFPNAGLFLELVARHRPPG